MATPPEIVQQPYNWWSSRNGHTVEALVAHNTVGSDSRAYLSRGGDLPDGSDRKVSIHYLIPRSGNPIYAYVSEERGANHAGFGTMPKGFTQTNPNEVTIGWELENRSNGLTGAQRVVEVYPDAQLLAMGWLINDIRHRRGRIPILLHRDIDPTRRHDPVGLTVMDIEAWAVKAAGLPSPGIYTVRRVPVYQGPARTFPIALNGMAFLDPSVPVEIDEVKAGGWGHLKSGLGFVDLAFLERA